MATGVETGADVARQAIGVRRLDPRWILYWMLVALNALDVVTTGLVLDRGGRETNPIIEPIVHNLALVSGLKIAVLYIIGFLLVRSRRSAVIDTALVITTGWYLAVVAWNSTVLTLL